MEIRYLPTLIALQELQGTFVSLNTFGEGIKGYFDHTSPTLRQIGHVTQTVSRTVTRVDQAQIITALATTPVRNQVMS